MFSLFICSVFFPVPGNIQSPGAGWGEASCSLLSIFPGSLLSLSLSFIHSELCCQTVFLKPLWNGEEYPKPTVLQKRQLNFPIKVPNVYLRLLFSPDFQKHRDFFMFKFHIYIQLNTVFSLFPFHSWIFFRSEVSKEIMSWGWS